jgi:hypothetical protein
MRHYFRPIRMTILKERRREEGSMDGKEGEGGRERRGKEDKKWISGCQGLWEERI